MSQTLSIRAGRYTFRNAKYVRYYHIRGGVKTLQDSSGVPIWEHFFSKIGTLASKYSVPAHELMIGESKSSVWPILGC